MVIVGIDSMILLYAGIAPRKDGAPPFAKELPEYARLLFRMLQREGCKIVLPTIAISELLVPVPSSKKGELLDTFKKLFICRPFDELAAVIASDIWAKHNAHPGDDKYGTGERDVLKADAMILGAAKAAGASRFYTNDARCRKLADFSGMQGCPLPTRDHSSLFTEKELEAAGQPLPVIAPVKKKSTKKKS